MHPWELGNFSFNINEKFPSSHGCIILAIISQKRYPKPVIVRVSMNKYPVLDTAFFFVLI
jgi:hypothetical protein